MELKELHSRWGDFGLKGSLLGLVGVVSCLSGIGVLVAGQFLADDTTRVWGSLLMNLMFFYCIALGGIVFASIQDVVGAVWGRPIRRIHESFGAFLVPGTLILIGFLLMVYFQIGGAHEVYKWVANPDMLFDFPGKDIWLVPGFMVIRDVVALLVMLGFALWTMRQTTLPDAKVRANDSDGALKTGALVNARLRFWSSPILFIYAMGFSLVSFDLTMSLSPLWFSTLWGGWAFSVMMHSLLAAIMVGMFLLKSSPIGSVFKKQQFHDIGKLMHGFTAFFGYLTFAHVLTYWYGNIPEETEYFLHRLHAPWKDIVIIAPFLSFALPLFALIPKASKWLGPVAVPISLVILFAQWLTYLIVVIPETADASKWITNMFWVEMGGFLAIFGIFLVSVWIYGKKHLMVPLGDPLLEDALQDGH